MGKFTCGLLFLMHSVLLSSLLNFNFCYNNTFKQFIFGSNYLVCFCLHEHVLFGECFFKF